VCVCVCVGGGGSMSRGSRLYLLVWSCGVVGVNGDTDELR